MRLQAKYVSRESFSDEELARTRVILASDSQRRARIKNLRTKMGFIARCVKRNVDPSDVAILCPHR